LFADGVQFASATFTVTTLGQAFLTGKTSTTTATIDGKTVTLRWQEALQNFVVVDVQDDREGCDPAYPTVCIPSPPPDLDCPDIPYRNFLVRSPDPHRFDADRDGLGCES
jgi:hypothetical protein